MQEFLADIAKMTENRNNAIKRQKRASLSQSNYMKTEDVKPGNAHNIVNAVKSVKDYEKPKNYLDMNLSCLNDQATLPEHNTIKGMNETVGVKPVNPHSNVTAVKPIKESEKSFEIASFSLCFNIKLFTGEKLEDMELIQ